MEKDTICKQENIKEEEVRVMGQCLGRVIYFYNADGSERSSITIWNDGTVTRGGQFPGSVYHPLSTKEKGAI